MNRSLPYLALFAGLAAVAWVGAGYLDHHPLALTMTLLVAAFYLTGALELRRYRQDSAALAGALAELRDTPPLLPDWLARLPASLQPAVRLRIDGERVGLPGPTLTPYLVGLLVLLGMLGTFLGMVVTLDGTGMALESASDLQSIRASLAAPVRGLGLAFGTSIAGVAASAMLGLASALCRRDRLHVAQRLDLSIATVLRTCTPAYRREESFRLLQLQAAALPALADRMAAMMAAVEQRGVTLDERLTAGQRDFHTHAAAAYTDLAKSVGHALKDSLSDSARVAAAAIQPVVDATMAGIARETTALHATVEESVARQLEGMSTRLAAAASDGAQAWRGALADHRRTSDALAADLRVTLARYADTFEEGSTALVDGVAARLDTAVERVADHGRTALAQHLTAEAAALTEMAASLQHAFERTSEQAMARQEAMGNRHAETARELAAQTHAQAEHTLTEAARLADLAAQAPRAAAELVDELRAKVAEDTARDHAMLAERTRLLSGLGDVLDAVRGATTEQRGAIDALVAASTEALDRAGDRLGAAAATQTGHMEHVAAQLTGSAVEVASLGEAFGTAVQLFGQTTEKLGDQLQRIETALGKSTARSDEQLAYYVAQAREVIDLSIMSQKQIVDDMQQAARRREAESSAA